MLKVWDGVIFSMLNADGICDYVEGAGRLHCGLHWQLQQDGAMAHDDIHPHLCSRQIGIIITIGVQNSHESTKRPIVCR